MNNKTVNDGITSYKSLRRIGFLMVGLFVGWIAIIVPMGFFEIISHDVVKSGVFVIAGVMVLAMAIIVYREIKQHSQSSNDDDFNLKSPIQINNDVNSNIKPTGTTSLTSSDLRSLLAVLLVIVFVGLVAITVIGQPYESECRTLAEHTVIKFSLTNCMEYLIMHPDATGQDVLDNIPVKTQEDILTKPVADTNK